MAEMVRTFIAIVLGREVHEALGEVIGRLRACPGGEAGRWVKPESIHLTLKFLGDVPATKLEAVYAAVQRACATVPPFEMYVEGVGCFPNVRKPRVVWAGVREETGRLAALQKAVEREMAKEGFAPEERPFTPHLTLARIKERADRAEIEALGSAVSQERFALATPVGVKEVYVMKSDLRPEGAIYTPLFRAPLAG